jgi:hypothetical protein
MPYTLKKYDGTTLLTLADGLTDNSYSSLTFVGKNVSNFGTIQNENILYLLENFASNVEPANKLRGQLWYDTQNYLLKFYNGGDWQGVGTVNVSATTPADSHHGYLWFDTTKNQLFVDAGVSSTEFQLIGPEKVFGFSETKFLSETVKDIYGTDHAVIKLLVNGETLGVISTDEFFVDSSNTIAGITKVYRGITAKNYETNDFPFVGRSWLSNLATTATTLLDSTSAVGISAAITATPTTIVQRDTSGNIRANSFIGVATTSSNLAGGSLGSIPYQTTSGSTTFLPLGTSGFVLTASPAGPQWRSGSSTTVGAAINSNYLQNSNGTDYIHASTSSVAGTIVERDSAGIMRGVATSAQYADLAEKYLADQEYEIGTVVVIGGEKEITASSWGQRAIGVISGNPAYMMNSELENGTYVALKGRVPVKVIGRIKKGEDLIAANNGCAMMAVPHASRVFAVALETNDDEGVKLVEALIL